MKKTRNPVARASILGKGGAHDKARSNERFKSRQKLRREARQWQYSKGAERPPSRWCAGYVSNRPTLTSNSTMALNRVLGSRHQPLS